MEDTLGWNVAGRIVRQPRLMRMETRRVRGNEWEGMRGFRFGGSNNLENARERESKSFNRGLKISKREK